MFSKDVKYVDFNNVEHVEKLHFHMMVPEFADLEFNPTFEGSSLSEWIREGMSSGNGQKVYTVFKLLIANSYGRRSADGSEFEKRADWTEKFFNSLAYEEFFVWLVSDPKNGEAFWEGIVPSKINQLIPDNTDGAKPKKKLTDMTKDELFAAVKALEESRRVPKEIEV